MPAPYSDRAGGRDRVEADVPVQTAVIGADLAGAGNLSGFGQQAETGQDERTDDYGHEGDP